MTDHNPDDVLMGDELRRRFASTTMSFNELAGRLQTTKKYCVEVFSGNKPLTKTFKERLLVVIKQSETGRLPERYDPPKSGEVVVGYCGSGANLPEDYEPGVAAEATYFPSGSKEKVEILGQRAERGEHLWHPADSKLTKRIGDD